MRVFRPIVEATTNLVAFDVADLAHRGGIGGKPVGDDAPRPAIFLHDPLQKLRRRSLVPLRPDHRFQNLAFVIDSPPEIAELAVDLHKDLIQMPTPLDEAAHVRNPPLSDLRREHRAKPVPPKPDCLMADIDPPLGQEILDVAQRQRVPDVHHHDQTDHFRRAVEISKRVAHGLKLPQPEVARKIGLTPPYPGTSIVHPLAAPQLLGRDHTITAYATIPETGAEGVLVCSGGEFGGWSLLIEDGRLHYVHNYLKSRRTRRLRGTEANCLDRPSRSRGRSARPSKNRRRISRSR